MNFTQLNCTIDNIQYFQLSAVGWDEGAEQTCLKTINKITEVAWFKFELHSLHLGTEVMFRCLRISLQRLLSQYKDKIEKIYPQVSEYSEKWIIYWNI